MGGLDIIRKGHTWKGREGKKYPGGQLEVFGRELGMKWTFELEFWVQ